MPYLFPYLETLRRQPAAWRQRISLLLSLVLTLIIFAAWLFIWQTNLAAKNEDSASRAVGPVSGVSTFIGEQVARVGLGFQVLVAKFK